MYRRRAGLEEPEGAELSVRLPAAMVEELGRAAASSRMTTAHYVQTTLELAVLDAVTEDEREGFESAYVPSRVGKIHTTYRLPASLRFEIRRAATAACWPVNKYVQWALTRHLELSEVRAERHIGRLP